MSYVFAISERSSLLPVLYINGNIMNLKKICTTSVFTVLTFSTATDAALGPIPIYLNTEYRTSSPVIGSIATSIKLDRDEIKKTGANTFTELMSSIPSVNFEGGQGNLTALRIRGNEASHTLLLVDGSVVSITATQPNFDVVPLDQIERVEITKGPFSSLYGPGAIGGVIHVFTNKDYAPGTVNKVVVSYGTHNSKKITLSSNISTDDGYLNYTLTDYHTDGIDATGNGDLDPIDRNSFSLNVGSNISDSTSIKLGLLKTNAEIQYDDTWSTPKPDNNLSQLNIELDHQFSDKYLTKIALRNQKTKRRGNNYKLNTIEMINEISLDSGLLSVGASSTTDKDIDNTDGIKTIKHSDIFSQWQGKLSNLEVSLGARIVDHDKFSIHNTYNLNLAREINEDVRVTASYGKATNLPSHYQNNLNLTRSKTELKPEHAISAEIGIVKQFVWGQVNTKVYKSKVTDAFKYNGTWGVDDHYVNDGTVNINGAEISANTNFMDWDIATNYDYNTAKRQSDNKQKGRRPNHTASITATKKIGNFSNRINLTAKSWVWDKDAHTNNDKLGGYGLLNLHSSYDYNKETTISLSVNNALNKDYEMAKGYNTHGRTTTLQIEYNF